MISFSSSTELVGYFFLTAFFCACMMIVPPASTFALHYMIGKVSIFGIVYSVQFPIWLSPCLDSTEI